jgi:hypothetical protein
MAMTVEILEDGGALITGTERELSTLVDNAQVALQNGSSHAPFLTDKAVSEFVIEVEAS